MFFLILLGTCRGIEIRMKYMKSYTAWNKHRPWKQGIPKGNLYSNHHFLGAMLVSGRVSCSFISGEPKWWNLSTSNLVHCCETLQDPKKWCAMVKYFQIGSCALPAGKGIPQTKPTLCLGCWKIDLLKCFLDFVGSKWVISSASPWILIGLQGPQVGCRPTDTG